MPRFWTSGLQRTRGPERSLELLPETAQPIPAAGRSPSRRAGLPDPFEAVRTVALEGIDRAEIDAAIGVLERAIAQVQAHDFGRSPTRAGRPTL